MQRIKGRLLAKRKTTLYISMMMKDADIKLIYECECCKLSIKTSLIYIWYHEKNVVLRENEHSLAAIEKKIFFWKNILCKKSVKMWNILNSIVGSISCLFINEKKNIYLK